MVPLNLKLIANKHNFYIFATQATNNVFCRIYIFIILKYYIFYFYDIIGVIKVYAVFNNIYINLIHQLHLNKRIK